MIVSISQPAYLPWLGYFERIAKSNIHVILDNVQLEARGYTHRNRIKTATGPIWLTIPIRKHGHRESVITDIEVDNSQRWHERHLKSIVSAYGRSPFFESNYSKLSRLFESEYKHLWELCYQQLQFWLNELGIGTRIVRASSLPVDGSKSDLILGICRELKATHYYSGALGKGYLDEDAFSKCGMLVSYQSYETPPYPQRFGEFVPNLSVVDFWMNCDEYSRIWRK